MPLSEIQRQPSVREFLRNALAGGKVHHAFLFTGPRGAGKAASARALAMALNCAADSEGCGTCQSCEKIAAATHPDFVAFDMTPKGLTERVRQLIETLAYPPHEGRARVVVFDPADELANGRAEAANALLKTLEEPPARSHFVLLAEKPRRLPITVRSRCQEVRFAPLLGGEDAGLGQEQLERLMSARSSAQTFFDTVSELGADRDGALSLMLRFSAELRDELMRRELPGGPAAKIAIFSALSSADLLRMFRITQEALASLEGNVAPSLAIEHVVLEMGKNP